MPMIKIDRPCYVMASMDGTEAEITMYGEIVETQPVDWWTGEPIEGSYIILKEFLNDLEQVSEAKKIKIRMNSVGGDAIVSIVIHNRLRELAAKGAELSCIVDGVAMSGGSIIICACDKAQVNPSSIIMIHKCWCRIFGNYNADELRSMAKSNDAYDKAMVSIYKRKSGLTDTVISHMMSETTYMTGKEAVEKGFADDLLDNAEPLNISASADKTALFVNGRMLHLAKDIPLPDYIPLVDTSQKEDSINQKSTSEGGKKIMAKNLEELRKENPELAAQIESEIMSASKTDSDSAANLAAEAERTRLAEIDKIANLFDDEIVQEAKYGKNPCTAQEMAYRAALKSAETGNNFMENLKSDYEQSGVGEIEAAAQTDDNASEAEKTVAAGKAAAADYLKAKKGAK